VAQGPQFLIRCRLGYNSS